MECCGGVALEVHGLLSGTHLQPSDVVLWVLGTGGGKASPWRWPLGPSCAVDEHTRMVDPCPPAGGFHKLSLSLHLSVTPVAPLSQLWQPA